MAVDEGAPLDNMEMIYVEYNDNTLTYMISVRTSDVAACEEAALDNMEHCCVIFLNLSCIVRQLTIDNMERNKNHCFSEQICLVHTREQNRPTYKSIRLQEPHLRGKLL